MKMQNRYSEKYTLTALIVDDEEYSRMNLSLLLQKHCPQIQVSGFACDINEAQSAIEAIRPEVIFLDVQMPGGCGFDLLQNYTDYPFEVVIVTAYPDYGIQAVKSGALDYILKPIRAVELTTAVQRAWKIRLKKRQWNSLGVEESRKIAVSHSKGVSLICKKDIVYLEADNMYTTLHLENDTTLLVSKSIKSFEQSLPDDYFFRLHKSYIINFRHIEGFSKANGGTVWMKNQVEIPVSRRQLPLFQKLVKWHTISI